MQISKNIDEIYPLIGELGLHQLLTLLILCLLVVPATYQNLIIYFVAHNPSWKCVSNSTRCEAKGVINDSNTEWYEHRCDLDRHEWEYVQNLKYSVVTEVICPTDCSNSYCPRVCSKSIVQTRDMCLRSSRFDDFDQVYIKSYGERCAF